MVLLQERTKDSILGMKRPSDLLLSLLLAQIMMSVIKSPFMPLTSSEID